MPDMRRPSTRPMNPFLVPRRPERVPFTWTALMRRPTTSFSRSRRSVSTSGSSGTGVLGLEGEPGLAGRRLLGLLFRAPLALAPRQLVDEHDRVEELGVVGALVTHLVAGQLVELTGRQLLQSGLEVLAAGPGRGLGDPLPQ